MELPAVFRGTSKLFLLYTMFGQLAQAGQEPEYWQKGSDGQICQGCYLTDQQDTLERIADLFFQESSGYSSKEAFIGALLKLNPKLIVSNHFAHLEKNMIIRLPVVKEKRVSTALSYPSVILHPETSLLTNVYPCLSCTSGIFFMGLADITISRNRLSDTTSSLSGEDGMKRVGRLAFFSQGTLKDKYKFTAQLDTEEKPLKALFNDFDDTDKATLFERVDTSRVYPVYGDDSTIERVVNTQGKIYALVEWDQSSVLWGNYDTGFRNTALFNYNRALYGARFDFLGKGSTGYGETEWQVSMFGAKPGHASAHDEFLGTGGSLYYLSHQDVVLGSAKLTIEVRAESSDRLLERVDLVEGTDYEIDQFSGRVFLNSPLSTYASRAGYTLIRDEPLGNNKAILVVDYEYVPSLIEDRKLTGGVRGKHWISDHLGVGFTVVAEDEDDYFRKRGIDLTLRAAENSQLVIEYGESSSVANIDNDYSENGGLTFTPITTSDETLYGDAIALRGTLDFKDFTAYSGQLEGWYRSQDKGFNTLDFNRSVSDRINYGLGSQFNVSDRTALATDYSMDKQGRSRKEKGSLGFQYHITRRLQLAGEVQHRVSTPETLTSNNMETKQDIVALKANYDFTENLSGFVSGQSVIDEEGMNSDGDQAYDMVGVGAEYRLSDALKMRSEYFHGENTEGGELGVNYRYSPGNVFYGAYRMETVQEGGRESLTAGQRAEVTEKLDVYQEYRFDHLSGNERQRGMSYGAGYDINERWHGSLSVLLGKVNKDGKAYDRNGYSVASRWGGERLELVNRLEYRIDENQNARYKQWVMANSGKLKMNESFWLLGKLDYSITKDQIDDSSTARYAEFDMGLAYRPAHNDRLNLLGMYSFIYDMDPRQSFVITESNGNYLDERAHVFSLEGIYQWTPSIEFGAKVAVKQAETRVDLDSGDFVDALTHLFIVNTRHRLSEKWSVMAEWRQLTAVSVDDKETGYLISVDYDVMNNLRGGAGYNFTRFNDDLTNLDYRSRGLFLNMVGKF